MLHRTKALSKYLPALSAGEMASYWGDRTGARDCCFYINSKDFKENR